MASLDDAQRRRSENNRRDALVRRAGRELRDLHRRKRELPKTPFQCGGPSLSKFNGMQLDALLRKDELCDLIKSDTNKYENCKSIGELRELHRIDVKIEEAKLKLANARMLKQDCTPGHLKSVAQMVSSGAAQLMQRTGDGRRKDELVFISPKCYIACVDHSVFKPWGLKRICKRTQLVARHAGSPGGVLCQAGAVPPHVSLCHKT